MRALRENMPLLLPCCGALVYLTLLGVGMMRRDHGLSVSLQVRGECQRLRDQIHTYRQENNQLRGEWTRLTGDMRYVEKIAREELQMVADREIVYVFPDSE